jgi:hypothetical protein
MVSSPTRVKKAVAFFIQNLTECIQIYTSLDRGRLIEIIPDNGF